MDFHFTGIIGWILGTIIMITAVAVILGGAIIISYHAIMDVFVPYTLKLTNGWRLFTRFIFYHKEFFKWYKSNGGRINFRDYEEDKDEDEIQY